MNMDTVFVFGKPSKQEPCRTGLLSPVVLSLWYYDSVLVNFFISKISQKVTKKEKNHWHHPGK